MSTVSQTMQNTTGRSAAVSQTSTKNSWDKAGASESFFEVFSSKVSGESSAHNKKYDVDNSRNDRQVQAEKTAAEGRAQAVENKDRPGKETDEPVVNESQDQQKKEAQPVDNKKPDESSEVSVEQDTNDQELVELPDDLAQQLLLLQMQAQLNTQIQQQDTGTDTEADGHDGQMLAAVGEGNMNISEKNTNANSDAKALLDAGDVGKSLQTDLKSEQVAKSSDQPHSQAKETPAEQIDISGNIEKLESEDTDKQLQELDLDDIQKDTKKTDIVTQDEVVAEEAVFNADEKVLKEDKKEQANAKYDDSRLADLKYKMEHTGSFQQNADMTGHKEKDQGGKQLKFNFGDENVSISGVSNAQAGSDSVKQALALDKSAPSSELNASATVETVVKSVKTMVQDGNSTMVVRLDPPSLGQLNIKISSGSEGMTIEIQASNAKTQEMLQQNSSQLRTALEKSGVSVNNVDIQFKPETRNNSNAGSDPQNNQQDLAGQHKNPEQRNNNDQDNSRQSFSESWSTESFEEKQFASADSFVTAGAGSNSWQELSFDAVDVRI